MKINLIEKIIGSAFFTGYFPFAPGTMGSFAALAIYMIPGFENPTIMMLMISLFIVIGIPIATKFEKVYGKDPKQCTVDEIVGTWISLLFVPKTIIYISCTFIIWRILDIVKPIPANYAEKINGGWGIMLDDIIAGFYTLLIIQMIIYFTH